MKDAVAEPQVSIIFVSYHSCEDLRACLPALQAPGAISQEIIVVDNAAGDGTAEFLRSQHPDITVIASDANRGFAWACNRGAAEARGEVLVFLNCDTIVTPEWLSPLVAALGDTQVGACMPRILLQGTRQVNTIGSCVHWSGLAWMDGWGSLDPGPGPSREVFGASGCALAMSAKTFREVGGFADQFFMYHEDVDICWRLRLLGYRILLVPEAAISHDYSFSRNPLKWQLAERNRIAMILANYRWWTLLLLFPGLILADLGLWAYAARAGLFAAKCRAACDLLRGLPATLRRRARVQRLRRVGDRELFRRMSGSVALLRASRHYSAEIAASSHSGESTALPKDSG